VAAAAHPPAWTLRDAVLARDNVELMLHDSVAVNYNWRWHCVLIYSMLPIGNI